MLRCPDIHMNELIALFITLHSGKAFALEAENLSALRTGRDFYFGLSISTRRSPA
jgi:hypothetical protein